MSMVTFFPMTASSFTAGLLARCSRTNHAAHSEAVSRNSSHAFSAACTTSLSVGVGFSGIGVFALYCGVIHFDFEP
jgi:hypothetical protein